MARLAPDIAASLNPPATVQDITLTDSAPPHPAAGLLRLPLTFNGQRHDNFTQVFTATRHCCRSKEIITTNQALRGLLGDDAVFAGFRENKRG